jgi:hypothetical protein
LKESYGKTKARWWSHKNPSQKRGILNYAYKE